MMKDVSFRAIKREDIPAIGNRAKPAVRLLMDFIDSGLECAEVELGKYSANGLASTMRGAVNRAALPVRVMQRDGRLFLVLIKKETRE